MKSEYESADKAEQRGGDSYTRRHEGINKKETLFISSFHLLTSFLPYITQAGNRMAHVTSTWNKVSYD